MREELSDLEEDADEYAERAKLHEAIEENKADLAAWDESAEAEELNALKALAEEGGGSPDWGHGEALIRDSYFERYAQELAEDCGMLKDTDSWPNRCIDWEKAADELKQDYFSVDFDGVDYWIRS